MVKRGWVVFASATMGCNMLAGIHDPIVDPCPDEETCEQDAFTGAAGGASSGASVAAAPSASSASSPTMGTGRCGDGIVDPGEECDTGTDAPVVGCAACKVQCSAPGEFEAPDTHHCYRLLDGQKASWFEARSICEDGGYYLAAITSIAELTFAQMHHMEDAWIGGDKIGTSFAWTDGEPWGWPPGTPDASKPGTDCVKMVAHAAAPDAADCGQALRFLCERSPVGKVR